MRDTLVVARRRHVPWVRLLIVAGAVIALASAVVGALSRQRMPEMHPVDFGQQVQITATDATTATIFGSTGLSQAPSCKVATANSEPVPVGEAERYRQGGGLESVFSFPVTAGTTYTVTCAAAEPGRFAVAQDAAVPTGVFIAAGSLGLVMFGVGLIWARRPRATDGSSHSPR